jgi:hypothetical protein
VRNRFPSCETENMKQNDPQYTTKFRLPCFETTDFAKWNRSDAELAAPNHGMAKAHVRRDVDGDHVVLRNVLIDDDEAFPSEKRNQMCMHNFCVSRLEEMYNIKACAKSVTKSEVVLSSLE